MRSSKIIHVVSCHAEGEVGDVIVGGVKPPPGKTIWEQRSFIARDQGLRNFVLNEPRGGVFRHVNLLVPPVNPEADAAWIIMEPEDMPPMSGSNSMCVSTVLLETGIIEMREPETRVTLESPGGLVEVIAQCNAGKVTSVQVQNVASFADKLDADIEVEGVGTLRVDTAYGGDSFVIADANKLGFSITPDEAYDLAQTGIKITNAANEQLGFAHPQNDQWSHISFCQIAAPIEVIDGVKTAANAVAIKPAKLDRSPCGTGVSARMAVMYAKGAMQVGEQFIARSIIGSRFDGRIIAESKVANRNAIIPTITGRAWITGTHQHMLDSDDPWPQGYRLSDTWPKIS